MKIYAIIDTALSETLGTLFYFEKEKTFIAELAENLDEWTPRPPMLSAECRKTLRSPSCARTAAYSAFSVTIR